MEICFSPIIRCSRFSCRKRKIGKQLFLPHNRFLTGYGGNLSSGNKSTHPLHLRMDSIFVPFPLNGVSFPMAELFPLVYHFISLVYGYPVRYMGTMNFSPVVFLPLFLFSSQILLFFMMGMWIGMPCRQSVCEIGGLLRNGLRMNLIMNGRGFGRIILSGINKKDLCKM